MSRLPWQTSTVTAWTTWRWRPTQTNRALCSTGCRRRVFGDIQVCSPNPRCGCRRRRRRWPGGIVCVLEVERQAGTYDFNPDATTYTPLLEGLQYVRNCVAGDVNGDGLDDAIAMVQGRTCLMVGRILERGPVQWRWLFDVSYVSPGTYLATTSCSQTTTWMGTLTSR